MTQPYAAGSLLSTVDDLFTWYTAVMNDKVISNENRIKAHTSFKLNNGKPTGYGYGWFLGNIQGSPMIQHGGGIHGYLTALVAGGKSFCSCIFQLQSHAAAKYGD
jgi:hypothetical protein